MELLFVAVGGAIFGAFARYLLPGRETSGALLLPAVGVVAACLTWVALTWAGLSFDGGWIWAWTIVVSVLAPVAVAVLIPRRRRQADDLLLAQLTGSPVA